MQFVSDANENYDPGQLNYWTYHLRRHTATPVTHVAAGKWPGHAVFQQRQVLSAEFNTLCLLTRAKLANAATSPLDGDSLNLSRRVAPGPSPLPSVAPGLTSLCHLRW